MVELDHKIGGWLTLFLTSGPRRNMSPQTVRKLYSFLQSMFVSASLVGNRDLGSDDHPKGRGYVAHYEYGALLLMLGTERLPFSASETRIFREFLERELGLKKKEGNPEELVREFLQRELMKGNSDEV